MIEIRALRPNEDRRRADLGFCPTDLRRCRSLLIAVEMPDPCVLVTTANSRVTVHLSYHKSSLAWNLSLDITCRLLRSLLSRCTGPQPLGDPYCQSRHFNVNNQHGNLYW